MRHSEKAARATLRNKQEHSATREQRSSAELRREKKPLERPKRERDIYKTNNSGADVPC